MSSKPPADISLDDLFSSNARPKEESTDTSRKKDQPFVKSGGRIKSDGVPGGGLPMAVDTALEGTIGGGPRIKKASEVGKSGLEGLSPGKRRG